MVIVASDHTQWHTLTYLHTHTHTHARTHSHTLSLSRKLTHTHTHTLFFIFYLNFSTSSLSLTSFIRPFHFPFRPVFFLCALHLSSFPSFLAFFDIHLRFFLSFFLTLNTQCGFPGRGIGPSRRPPTTHNTHNTQAFMSSAGFQPTIQASDRTQTTRPVNSAIISSADSKYNPTPSEPKP